MAQPGVGSVTVRVTSLNTPGITALATAMVQAGGTQPPGAPDVNQLVEVAVVEAHSTLDRQTRQVISTADVFITNISDMTLRAPMQAQFVLSDPDVEILEAITADAEGHAVVDLTDLLPDGALRPGESLTLSVTFVRPFPGRFTYDIMILGTLP